MIKKGQNRKIYMVSGFFLGLIINLLMFSVLPNLSFSGGEKKKSQEISAIKLAFFPPELPPESEEKQDENIQEESIKRLKPVTKKIVKTNIEKIKMEMPVFNLNIAPQINTGIEMDSPSPEFKEFYNLSELDKIPLPKFKKRPVYPYRARRMNIEGDVVVRFIIKKDGTVTNIKIVKSNPPGIFDKSAINCISSWKFAPGELSGQRVDSVIEIPLVFKLNK